MKTYKKKTQVFFYHKNLKDLSPLIESLKKISSLSHLKKDSKLHYFKDEFLLCEHLESLIRQKASQILLLDLENKKRRVEKAFKHIQSHEVFKDLSTEILKGEELKEEEKEKKNSRSLNAKREPSLYSLKPYTHSIQIFPFCSLMKEARSLEEYWWMNFEIPKISQFYSKSP